MGEIDEAGLRWLANNKTSPGPGVGESIDPTKPGPTADRIAELEREIAEGERFIADIELDGFSPAVGTATAMANLRAELARLRNEQPKGGDAPYTCDCCVLAPSSAPSPEPQDVREALREIVRICQDHTDEDGIPRNRDEAEGALSTIADIADCALAAFPALARSAAAVAPVLCHRRLQMVTAWSDAEARRQRSDGAAPEDGELLDAMDATWIEAPLSIGRDHQRFDFLVVGRIEQRDIGGLTAAWFGAHKFGSYRDPEVAASTVFRAWSRCCEIALEKPASSRREARAVDAWVVPFTAGIFLTSVLFSIMIGAGMIKLSDPNPLLTECLRHLQGAAHAEQPAPPKASNRPSD